MKHDFPIIHLQKKSIETDNLTDLWRKEEIYRVTLLQETQDSLLNHLADFWSKKGEIASNFTQSVLRRYGVGEHGEGRHANEDGLLGPAYVYGVSNATVMPSMNVVLHNNSVVADVFGVSEPDYIDFCSRYRNFFGIDESYSFLSVSNESQKWRDFFKLPLHFLTLRIHQFYSAITLAIGFTFTGTHSVYTRSIY